MRLWTSFAVDPPADLNAMYAVMSNTMYEGMIVAAYNSLLFNKLRPDTKKCESITHPTLR